MPQREDFEKLFKSLLMEFEEESKLHKDKQVVIPVDLPSNLVRVNYGIRYSLELPALPTVFSGTLDGKEFDNSKLYHSRLMITGPPSSGYLPYLSIPIYKNEIFIPEKHAPKTICQDSREQSVRRWIEKCPVPVQGPHCVWHQRGIIAIARHYGGFWEREAEFVFSVPFGDEYEIRKYERESDSIEGLVFDFKSEGHPDSPGSYSAGFTLELKKEGS